MGLDQCAYIRTAETGEEGESAKFVWRKHSKLQIFMEALYFERTGLSGCDLNGGELKLEAFDIDTLEHAIKESALPQYEGGGSSADTSFKTSKSWNAVFPRSEPNRDGILKAQGVDQEDSGQNL